MIQNQAKGIYNQMYDIVDEIDRERLTDIQECKKLINQVRIQTITLNKNLGAVPEIIRPYDFFDEKTFEPRIVLEKKKIKLRKELEDAKTTN